MCDPTASCIDFLIRNENATSERNAKRKIVWNNIACRASYIYDQIDKYNRNLE